MPCVRSIRTRSVPSSNDRSPSPSSGARGPGVTRWHALSSARPTPSGPAMACHSTRSTRPPAPPPELLAVADPRDEAATRRQLHSRVVQTASNVRLALGHHYPLLRPAIAEQLIRDTSRVNAQAALLSSLPSLIPVLGMIVGGVAD